MTDGQHNGSGISVLLGALTLLAVGGTVDPASAAFFETHWPTCVYIGAIATVLYVALAFADGRPSPGPKAMVSQAVVTFLVTGGLPMVGESWWPSQPKPGIYFVEAVGGGMFTYLLISSVNEAVRAAQKDGSIGKWLSRFIQGWGQRLAGPAPVIIPPAPSEPRTTTVTRTNVNTVEMTNGGSTARSDDLRQMVFDPHDPGVGDDDRRDRRGGHQPHPDPGRSGDARPPDGRNQGAGG